MSTIQQATDVLRAAEERLRELIAQAAGQAEYDTLSVLAGWAKRLHGLWNGEDPLEAGVGAALHGLDGGRANGQTGEPADELPASRPAGLATVTPAKGRQRKKKTGTRKGKARAAGKAKKREYPQFLREGGTLVKIGWSRSDKRTYEHRAPQRVIDLLVAAMARAGAGGERFAMEALLPLRDPQENDDVPDYQAYLALAWLRTEDLVVQHGRQGYSLPAGTDLSSVCEERWQALPAR